MNASVDRIEFPGELGGHWLYFPSRPLGEPGGFGCVYQGEDVDSGDSVAVKVSHPELEAFLGPGLLEREREIAERMKGSDLAYLLPVIDWGAVHQSTALVMPLADRSLSDVIAGGAVGQAEAVAILKDLAAGLRELHDAQLFHRDLSPSDVLLHMGRWKLADFGMSRDAQVGTQTESFKFGDFGRPHYKAPELWEGKSPSVKSDLYSLGCVAYELLMGSPPFDAATREEIGTLHRQSMPPSLGTDVDPILAALVSRLLLKDPDSRPASARDVEVQLTQVGAPVSAAEERLLRAIKTHVDERARRDSALAAERVEAEGKQAVRRQAVSDLRNLCGLAQVRIEGLVPGLRVSVRDAHSDFRTDMVWEFRSEDAMLAVVLWASVTDWQVPGDTIALGGEVVASSRLAPDRRVRLANIVYEGADGHLHWNLYRFQAALGNDRYGPEGIPHGFSLADFGTTRRWQIDGTYDGWTLEKVVLSAQSIVEFFAAAHEMQFLTG